MRVFRQFLRVLGLGLGLCTPLPFALDSAHAESAPEPPQSTGHAEPLGYERYRTPIASSPDYWHTFGSLALGDGLRFNNPYRLATPLGKTPESLSLTAAYVDLGLGVVRGPSDGLGHGAVLHLSIAAQGIPQEVLSLSYIALERFGNGRTMLFGRFGIPVILQPDLSGGLETAFGAAFMVSAGIGVQSELVGSLYYGAGTLDRSVTTIPVLSGELGVFFDYEVLKMTRREGKNADRWNGSVRHFWRHGRQAALALFALLLCTAPTPGDVGGCGQRPQELDPQIFFASKEAIDCQRCDECAIGSAACKNACTAPDSYPKSFPDRCLPLVHDGEVCLRALLYASCADYEQYMSDKSPTAPTECNFCPEPPP